MTKHEAAVIMAYTGVIMLKGDDISVFWKYCESIYGRAIWTHEYPTLAEKIKDLSNFEEISKKLKVEKETEKTIAVVLELCYFKW